MTFENIVKHIESLPPLSDSAILIEKLYAEGAENVDIIKLVRIIESDALLTANILKMINAPFYGFSKKIASVAQAVSLFGTNIVYGLVMSYALNEKLVANLSPYGVSSVKFNEICHLQSTLLTQWHSKIDLRHAQFLAPLALIMEAGKLILANEISASDYAKEFKKGLANCNSVEDYEDELVGTTSYYVSGVLFEHWNLEPLYVRMLKNLDYNEEELTFKMEYYIKTLNVVRTAVNIKDILTDKSIANASKLVKDMDLDEEYFEHVAKRIKTSYMKKN